MKFYQTQDKLIKFMCKKNINHSKSRMFFTILLDKLFIISLVKCIINQMWDKLHSINDRQQIVECVLLSPIKSYL